VIHWEKNFQINWDHQDEKFRGAVGTRAAGSWYAASFKDLQADTWYHLAATYDGNSLKAYKDGTLITSTPTPEGSSDAENETLKLGRHAQYADTTNYFGGILDDVRIYNYALSADDISAIHAGKEPLTESHPKIPATGDEDSKMNISLIVVLTVGVIVTVVCTAVLILLSIRRGKTTL